MKERVIYNKELHKKQLFKYNELKGRLPEISHDFLDDKRRSGQISSAIQYAYDLLIFFEYFGDTDLNSLTYKDINEFQDYLESSDNHTNKDLSIKRKMAAIHGFFLYGVSHGLLTHDPVVIASTRKKPKEKSIVYMELKEVEKLMWTVDKGDVGSDFQKKHLKNYRFRDTAILSLFLNTGIRVSELVGLNIDDLNFNMNSMTITRKGGKVQKIYFNDVASVALQDYIEFERPKYLETDDEQALFLSNRKKRVSVHAVQNIASKYATAKVTDKHITAHKYRSTYGSNLYQTTGDIKLTADVLGHSDINTTSKYYAAQSENNRKKAGKINLYK